MNTTAKATLIAIPVAILVQGLLLLFAKIQFGDGANLQLLSAIGVGTGMVSYFAVKRHLSKSA